MGEIAAIATAALWACSSLFFTSGSKAIGSQNVNRIRLVFAMIWLMITHTLMFGTPLPNASLEHWFWMALSGIVGLVLGDGMLFQSYVLIGPRLGTLLMGTSPVMGTVLAFIFLGEQMPLLKIFAILVAVSGVCLVVLDRKNGSGQKHTRRDYIIGILLGLGGGLCQAVGLILSKRGLTLTADFPSISAVVMRTLAALIIIWLLTAFTGQLPSTLSSLKNSRAIGWVFGGSIVGPFIGVWASLIAVQYTKVGIASTLMALTPVIMLPIARFAFKEKVSTRGILGTVIAITGVALIFLL